MPATRLRRKMLLVAIAAMILAACETSPSPTSDNTPPPTAYKVTIALIGLDPSSITVPVGARVTFINNDTNFAHHMTSPCSEVDSVGHLNSGQSGQTAAFGGAKTCSYWDRLYPENPLRQGTIIVR